jgi:starch synthase
MVTRLAYQKGIDVFVASLEELLRTEDVQFAILGSGDHDLEGSLAWFAARYPGKFAVRLGYDERIAHIIEGGSDLFLMPSRYEPCGLNQMYSMRYGSLPIVRATGGLDDTVVNYEIHNLDRATGFKFWELNRESLLGTLRWAIGIYRDQPSVYRRIQRNAMSVDFSWTHTAREYERLYEDAH